MSQDTESANQDIEVTDVNSLAAALEQSWDDNEQGKELPEPKDDEALEEPITNADDEDEPDEEETETSDEDLDESEEQEPDAEESENLTYQNVNELAEALEMSPEDFLENIKITRKIDGVEEEVTLAELRNGNQRDADYRRKTTAHADNVRAWEAEQAEVKAQIAQQFQEAAAVTATLEQQLLSEYQSIDWNALELEDREEWLVQRQKFGERQQQVETIKAQVNQNLTAQQQEQQERQKEAYNALLAEQNEKLLNVIPEWADTSIRESENKEMTAFLGDYGFSEQEVGQVIDHRLVKLARDAMQNKGKTSQIETVKKKVKKLPKLVKPGAKPDKVVLQKKQKQDKRNSFIKKDRHTTAEIADFLMGE